ncbi:Crp/Fnr family transcriptional regulator [Mucilaginibacter sp. RS28]|uniref:Crp/Fnr family transcriptional regulator n=1 Tax=Mucilaginibacter straminoryzae TaxID=2932774 RepID=A0A9X1X5M1_9SPHI|nr:Crp/Fnr family transcriptional regulator [Mucilaginibacter straminoryzae]MCJ8210043.1 Crp/Fnr family transcriptional regulator [Mucilaginibacter straminoryzae]
MYPQLISHIGKYVQLTHDEEQLLCEYVELRQYKKKAYLLEAGKHCPGNFFTLKGVTRMYLINDDLNEQIVQFSIENWWIADYDSLLNKQPARYYIQALEPTEVLLLPDKNVEHLFDQIPKLERYFRIMMQRAYVASQRRIGFIYGMSDEERYRHFLKLNPEFVQRVPQYMLASYLGFTPQFMSRIRAKKV